MEALEAMKRFRRLDSTKRSYNSLLRCHFRLCDRKGWDRLRPPTDAQIAISMAEYVVSHKSTSLTNFLSALKAHYGPLAKGAAVRDMREQIARIYGPVDQKVSKNPCGEQPLSVIFRIARLLPHIFFSSEHRMLEAMGVQYAFALRISEVFRIRRSHVRSNDRATILTVIKAKNHRQPKHTIVSRDSPRGLLCGATAIDRACARAKRPTDFLFKFTPAQHNAFIKRTVLRWCGFHATSHSLRAGWVTDAFRRGMPEQLMMLHGRWASVQGLRHYFVPTLEDRLAQLDFYLRRH